MAKLGDMYYCKFCGYSMSAIKRSVHIAGQPHKKVVNSSARILANKYVDGWKLDKEMSDIREGVFEVFTVKDPRPFNVLAYATDSLGNYHIVTRGKTHHELFKDEVEKILLVRGMNRTALYVRA